MTRLASILMLLILALLVAGACSGRRYAAKSAEWDMAAGGGYIMEEPANRMMLAQATSGRDEALPPGAAPAPVSPGSDGSLGRMQQSATDRYLIRNANLTIEVKDPAASVQQVAQLTASKDGYMGDLYEQRDHLGRIQATVTLRIPAKEFEPVLLELEKLGTVFEKRVNSQDVTEEYVDTQAAIRNLKAAEVRLLDHLSESKKLSDTLEVERELTRIRGQIEQHEGRLRYLSHRVDFSTITLTLREEARTAALTPPQKYSTGQEFSAAVRDLVAFLQGLWTTIIWFAVWAVIWLPILLLARWGWLRLLKSLRRPRTEPLA